MYEQSYPISCPVCGQSQYGPVKYCPYCGIAVGIAPTKVDERENTGSVPGNSIEGASPDSVSPKPSPQPRITPPAPPPEDVEETIKEDETVIPGKIEKPEERFVPTDSSISHSEQHLISGKWKWITVALVLVIVVVGTLVFRGKGQDGPHGSGKETARILALDAIRQGTDLSVTISKLPKLENVLQAAQQLQDISPRYQEQVASAKSTIHTARISRDKQLMAYLGKVLELSRYKPEHISYALGIIQKGDPTPREKIVAELLAVHLNSMRNSTKPDPEKLISNFAQRFNDFAD